MTSAKSRRNLRARTRHLLLGVGSIFDIAGTTTYERMRQEMPAVTPRSLNYSLGRATQYLTQELSSRSPQSSSRN